MAAPLSSVEGKCRLENNPRSNFQDALKNTPGGPPTGTETQRYLAAQTIETPLGLMLAGAVEQGICWLEYVAHPIPAHGHNPISIVIPCHRVIGKDGSLTGYSGGLWRKRVLLELERTGKLSGS